MKLFELRLDVTEVALEVLVHRTALAIPFGALVGRRRQAVVRTAEKVLPERELHKRPAVGLAPIAPSNRHRIRLHEAAPKKDPNLTPSFPRVSSRPVDHARRRAYQPAHEWV